MNQYFLEGSVEYYRFSSVPDTPDGFGIAGAVSFDTTDREIPLGRPLRGRHGRPLQRQYLALLKFMWVSKSAKRLPRALNAWVL